MKLARYSRDYTTTFLQFDWLRAVVIQLNLKCLHVKITNLLQINGLETKISRTFLDFLHSGHEFFVISGHGT